MTVCGKKTPGFTALLSLCAVSVVSGCATAPRPEPVSTTTTTSAGAYEPRGGVDLYLARHGEDGRSCSPDLPPTVEFAHRSAVLLPAEHIGIEKWARCLNRPELAQTTVVLVGGDDPAAPTTGLFVQRAEQIKAALVRYGVDERRIVIGASNASREGGPWASVTGVRLELTHSQNVRSYPSQDPAVRYGIRR